MNRPFLSPLRLNPELPAKFEDILNKALEKDRDLRYRSAADIHTDLKRLRRDTDSGRMLASGSSAVSQSVAVPATPSSSAISATSPSSLKNKGYLFAAFAVVVLAAAFAAYHFLAKPSNEPARITRISRWNKPIIDPILSPDGHTFAFASSVGDVNQIFVMLSSGGDPLQLTTDPLEKAVDSFSPDGTLIYYELPIGSGEVWSVPTLGGPPARIVEGKALTVSPADGSLFFLKFENSAIFQRHKTGLAEEPVINLASQGMIPSAVLPFPDGKDLLAVAGPSTEVLSAPATATLYKVNLASHSAAKLGEVSGTPSGFVWLLPGKSFLCSRTVNDVTNLWQYTLSDGSLQQLTFSAGPDSAPMPDPTGKGIYFVTGRQSGALAIYNTRTKQSFDLISENATQPLLSWDGRHVNYVTLAGPQHQELWFSDIDGHNKVKLTSSAGLITLAMSPDSSQLVFVDVVSDSAKLYLIKSDGSGLKQIPWSGANVGWAMWSPDGKTLYFSGYVKDPAKVETWKFASDSSKVEGINENCGWVQDVSADGRHLLSGNTPGNSKGLYDFSLPDNKCTTLLPDFSSLEIHFSPDGKSILYLLGSRGETVIYRLPWHDGKLTGPAQPVLKLPFTFRQGYFGNAYDFSKDLSTVVYARPNGQADLYLLSQR